MSDQEAARAVYIRSNHELRAFQQEISPKVRKLVERMERLEARCDKLEAEVRELRADPPKRKPGRPRKVRPVAEGAAV